MFVWVRVSDPDGPSEARLAHLRLDICINLFLGTDNFRSAQGFDSNEATELPG
jgi:hypothetical protein